jgi:hypothetical protein
MWVDFTESSLASDCILPVQWRGLFRREHDDVGERRLLLAVLRDALDLVTRPPTRTPIRPVADICDARRWFESDDRSSPFCFLPVAEALGLEPGPLRAAVLNGRVAAGPPRGPSSRLSAHPRPASGSCAASGRSHHQQQS